MATMASTMADLFNDAWKETHEEMLAGDEENNVRVFSRSKQPFSSEEESFDEPSLHAKLAARTLPTVKVPSTKKREHSVTETVDEKTLGTLYDDDEEDDDDASHQGELRPKGATALIVYKLRSANRRTRCWMGTALCFKCVGLICLLVVLIATLSGKLGWLRDQVLPADPEPTASDEDDADTSLTEVEGTWVGIIEEKAPYVVQDFELVSSSARDALQWMLRDAYSLQNTKTPAQVLQRFALVTLWFSLEAWGEDKGGWLVPDKHECDWGNVTADGTDIICNDNHVVEGIFLWDGDEGKQKLLGTIPAELCLLETLEFIDVRSNDLRSSIPTEIGLITSLTHLDVSNNILEGTVPTEIGLLVDLEVLALHSNKLTGDLPTEQLEKLSKLEELQLYNNAWLGGEIPTTLCLDAALTEAQIDCGNVECVCCEDSKGNEC